ncbi:MAG TPA: YceH family protein [Candidatus Angelobacter sp.]|nr:YceH family protein [Candidatus Angelobacter sp.]
MKILLNQAEARVLGSLIEKDITTPDYYPLSLNSLISACNQKSNREPVMTLDEETVRLALRNLQEKKLAGPVSGADSRVTKYEHRLQEVFNFDRRETAIVCVLLLRGPQTPGELRGRTERMHRFDDLSEVQSALQSLMQRDPPIAKVLPRQPGTKEARYMHLFCGDVEPLDAAASLGASAGSELELERIERLENEVAGLRKEIADLKQQVQDLQAELRATRDAPMS